MLGSRGVGKCGDKLLFLQWEVTNIRLVNREPGDIILSNRFANNNPFVYGRYQWF